MLPEGDPLPGPHGQHQQDAWPQRNTLPMRLGPSRIGKVTNKSFALHTHTHQIGTQDITDTDDPVTSLPGDLVNAASDSIRQLLQSPQPLPPIRIAAILGPRLLSMFVRVGIPPDHDAARDLLLHRRACVCGVTEIPCHHPFHLCRGCQGQSKAGTNEDVCSCL